MNEEKTLMEECEQLDAELDFKKRLALAFADQLNLKIKEK